LLTQTGQLFIFAQEEGSIQLSHKHGFYYEPFTLFVESQNQNAKLHYTLDGTHPFYSSTSIKGNSTLTIEINPANIMSRDYAPGVVVRACEVREDTLIGKVITQTYLFPNSILLMSRDNVLPGPNWLNYNIGHDISYGLDPEVYNNPLYSNQMQSAFLSIPTISLVTDLGSLFNPDSGIYVNALYHGEEWERAASIELLNPDGSEGFQENCGIRIRGGWSRHYDNPKHAFRIIFRKEYGAGKLKYPLFDDEGADEFDNIDLRTAQNYSWSFYGNSENTFLREVFSRDTQKDMDQPYTRSRYYHLYINGTYWGLYQSQERSEASYAETYFGGNKEDYDVIKVDVGDNFDVYHIEATDGSLQKWKELWDFGEIGFGNDELYYQVQGLHLDGTANSSYEKLLDVDNLIDYMIITFFTGDFDGPISAWRGNESPNNFYAIYNRINPDGFKFFRHDGEHTLFNRDWGIDRTGPFSAGQNFLDSNPQWIHQKLSENKNYRLRFADRVYKHFYNNGALTLKKVIERIEKRKAEIETAIIAESARWGDSKRIVPRTKVDWENEINFILNDYLPSRSEVVLNQLINKNLFFPTSIPEFNLHGGIVEKGFDVEITSNIGSIYYTTNRTDPMIPFNKVEGDFSKEIIPALAKKTLKVPNNDIGTEWYKDIGYNDDNWFVLNSQLGGIGYDDNGTNLSYIGFNTKQYMHESGNNPNTSCYIRIPFNITSQELAEINFMNLDMRYDDGFVAYLNGEKILVVNAPNNPLWNSTSLTYLNSNSVERFNISDFIDNLNDGENLLAIHGLNTSIQSSDFLILPILIIGKQSISGSISPDAKLYDKPINISETTTIKTRGLVGEEWSVLNSAQFLVDEDLSSLKITELHYHPLDEIIGNDTISGKQYEFIEIKNVGNVPVTLTGSRFTSGIQFEFPNGTIINSGDFILIVSDTTFFESRYGLPVVFEYEGNLDNSGERITLENPLGDTVFTFKYNDKNPWPEAADGGGYSLVSKRQNPIGNPTNLDYWTLSGEINGSPFQNDIVSDVVKEENSPPTEYSLSQNYPNPFNPNTTIKYSLLKQSHVTLSVFDILGRRVKLLVNEIQQAGNYRINFNAQRFASGIYYYQIQSNDFVQIKKMVILK
jgi:hypothetical protein